MTAAEQPTDPVLDLAAVRAHLARYRGAPGELSIVSDLDWSGQRFPTSADGIGHAVEYIRDLDVQGAAGIYHRGTTVRPDAPSRGRGRAEHSVSWLAVQLDVDYGKPGYAPDATTARGIVLGSRVPAPTSWVHSGHGVYPTWLLDAPTEDSPFLRSLVVDLHAEIADTFRVAGYRIDPGVVDAARVWRIPGTVNRKDDEHPVPCLVLEQQGPRYGAGTLRGQVRAAGPEMRPGTPNAGAASTDRRFTLDQAKVYVGEEALRPLSQKVPGTGVNIALNDAACVVGHFVGGGFLSYADAMEALLLHCPRGWDEPDGVRQATIRSGLRKGMTEPYTLTLDAVPLLASTPPPVPAPPVGGLQPATAPIDAPNTPADIPASPPSQWSADEAEDAAFRVELDKERRRRRVREYLAAEDAPPVQVLDFAAFLATPAVEYLVPGMLWRTGCARIFGPPGGTKSFLVLDLALCLAAGVPWRGTALGQRVVHYVMAEGQSVNAARAASWMHDRGVLPGQLAENFRPITGGITLTPEGIAAYLPRVRAERPALIVLDTKARMMVGSVNRPEDNAAVVRAVDMLREASGGCVVLVDHTGVHDLTRAKGDNTVEAAMDTEIRVARGEGGVCTAEVSRDKAAETGTSWSYVLRTVGSAAVCSPVDSPSAQDAPFRVEGDWWSLGREVPEKVVTSLKGEGRACALDIYRLLAFVGGERGMTPAEICTTFAGGPRKHSRPSVYRALAQLAREVTGEGSTKERVLLRPEYVPDLDRLS